MTQDERERVQLRPREAVIHAVDFDGLVAWYRDVLGFTVVKQFDEGIHYCNLETLSGIQVGIADAKEMGLVPADRSKNTVLLQFEVDDVQAFLAHIKAGGGAISFGPNYNEKDGFWFGAFADPEGNPFWVVDAQCP